MNIIIPKPLFIILLVLLNMVPVYGVFAWGWQSFDLIFLYWLENLIIGAFAGLRFLVRPYSHMVELIPLLFIVPFFTFHYGMFCYGHGTFILSLFGKGILGDISSWNVFAAILPIIESQQLLWPVLALLMYQLLDWVRDTSERGFGSDGIKDLMVAPYRRIVILHVAIIASGFALAALNEPLAGLLILIVLKTGFDLYHWNKDEQAVEKQKASPLKLSKEVKQRIDAFLEDPKIVVNGKDVHFESYADLKASKYYIFMKMVTAIAGGNQQLKLAEAHIKKRFVEKIAK